MTMSPKVFGAVDIAAGLLLIIARGYFQSFSFVVLIIGFLLLGKGIFSWV